MLMLMLHPAGWKQHDPMIISFDSIAASDGRTDRTLPWEYQSINQSMEFVKRPLQSWTVALDRSKLQ